MSKGISLINLGELSKPATVLIEKVSEAVGGVFRPMQIKRVAEAKAETEKIKASARIEVSEIEQRAVARLFNEEGKKQENIEKIAINAAIQLEDSAKPEDIDSDWIANFFDRCRLISDKEMQELWSKLLAGEANQPGYYSKRTINIVANLDKDDAQLFTNLLTFKWQVDDLVATLVYDEYHKIYNDRGINFNSLHHLEDIGLIKLGTFGIGELPKSTKALYYGDEITIEFQTENNNGIESGKVLLTRAGRQLVHLCGSSTKSEEFRQYVLERWRKFGYVFSA